MVGNQHQSNSNLTVSHFIISYADIYIIMLNIQSHNFKCIFLLDCHIILKTISMLVRSKKFAIMSVLSIRHCPFETASNAVKFHQTNSLYSLYITRNGMVAQYSNTLSIFSLTICNSKQDITIKSN